MHVLFLDDLGKCGGELGVSGQKTIYHGTEILWEYHQGRQTCDIIIFLKISQQFFGFENLAFVGDILIND